MATFKEYIFTRDRKKDGTYAVKIRVTHNRKSRYLPTNIFVTDAQITRTGKIKDKFIQDIIDKHLKELREAANAISIGSERLTVDEFVSSLMKRTDSSDFFVFADNFTKKMKETRIGTYNATVNALNSFKRYIDKDTLMFDEMNKTLIQGYYEHLLDTISIRSSNSYIKLLNNIYKEATRKLNDEEAGVIVVKYHPFDALKKETPEKTASKSFKTVEQMQAVIDCPYTKHYRANFAKDMFILSFLLNGSNMADIGSLKHEQYQDGKIAYSRKKTVRVSGKKVETVIKVLDVADMIIRKYKGDPFYLIKYKRIQRQFSHSNMFIHEIFQLAGVEDKSEEIATKKKGSPHREFTFNTARHTMASFSRNICKTPKDIVDLMLNHAEAEVDVYYQKPYELMWEANEKLYALFNWEKYKQQLRETTI